MKKLTIKQIEKLENKTRIQLEGINEASKIFNDIVSYGYGNLNDLQINEKKIVIKNLKGFQIKQIETMFAQLIKYIEKDQSKVAQQLIDINAILVKAQNYLEQKLVDVANVEDRELEMLIQSPYTFNTLKKDGAVNAANIALMTVAKDLTGTSKPNEIWLNLDTLELYKTKGFLDSLEPNYVNYTPYLQIAEMAFYPESNTPKIAFKEFETKPLMTEHYQQIIENSYSDYNQVENQIKNYLKHPLHKYGYYLIQIKTIHVFDELYIIENSNQQYLKTLKSTDFIETQSNYINSEKIDNGAALIEVSKDENQKLILTIKTIITGDGLYMVN